MAESLTGCEPCAFWTYCGCLKRLAGYPVVGKACRGYEREPGVEG